MIFDQGERKKLKVLGALVAVGLLVVGMQVVRKKGPATAKAAGEVVTAAKMDLAAVLQEMQSGQALSLPGQGSGGVAFTSIDEALEVFAGGGKATPLPLEALRSDVFGVPKRFLQPPAPPVAELKSAPVEEKAAEPQVDPIDEEFATLRLVTCMVSARNRAAIINGNVLHCGETIGSFTVTEIAPSRVVLRHEAKQYTLTLQ